MDFLTSVNYSAAVLSGMHFRGFSKLKLKLKLQATHARYRKKQALLLRTFSEKAYKMK